MVKNICPGTLEMVVISIGCLLFFAGAIVTSLLYVNQKQKNENIAKKYKEAEVKEQMLRTLIDAQNETIRDLRKIEENYKISNEIINEGVFVWNLKSDSVYYSPKWKELFGAFDSERLVSLKDWESKIHYEDILFVRNTIKEAIAKKKFAFDLEYRAIITEGKTKKIITRGKIIYNEKNEPEKIFGSSIDINDAAKLAMVTKNYFSNKLRVDA